MSHIVKVTKRRILSAALSLTCIATLPSMSPPLQADEGAATVENRASGQASGQGNGQVNGSMMSTFSIPLRTTDGEIQVTVYGVETNKAKSLAYAPPFEIDFNKSRVSLAQLNDGPPSDYTVQDFVAQVQKGQVAKDAEVTLSLYVRFGDSLAMRRSILQIARHQDKYSFDEQDEASDKNLLEDPMFIRSKCNPVHMRRLELKLSYAGKVYVETYRDNNPTYASKTIFQVSVPAFFVERLTSSVGVEGQMTYYPLLVNEQSATAVSGQSVDEAVDNLFKEFGKGGLTINESSPSVVIDRNVASSIVRKSRWAEKLVVTGDSLALINAVLQLIQRKELDIFSATENEIETALTSAYNWAKFAEEKGAVQLIEKLGAGETLTEKETETLRSRLHAHANSSNGGGGISLGPIALGGGGGSTSGTTTARTDQDRQFAKNFASWLNKGAVSGQMPLPPSLNLVRVDKQLLSKNVDQIVEVTQRSATYSAPVAISINTAEMLNLGMMDRFLDAENRLDNLKGRIIEPIAPPK